MSKFVVGLTGGIASGKTVVSNLFAKLGVEVIDTDLIARELVEPGQPALRAIADHFGESILNGEQLNRKKLGKIIFDDANERLWLNQLLHPKIRQEVQKRIVKSQALYCLCVIPLLTQSDDYPYLNRVCVVDVPEAVQLGRLMERDQLSASEAALRLKAQASRDDRLTLADDVIENTGTLETLKQRVQELHQRYLSMSGVV